MDTGVLEMRRKITIDPSLEIFNVLLESSRIRQLANIATELVQNVETRNREIYVMTSGIDVEFWRRAASRVNKKLGKAGMQWTYWTSLSVIEDNLCFTSVKKSHHLASLVKQHYIIRRLSVLNLKLILLIIFNWVSIINYHQYNQGYLHRYGLPFEVDHVLKIIQRYCQDNPSLDYVHVELTNID